MSRPEDAAPDSHEADRLVAGADGGEIDPELLGHPKGTLAIVLIYGALFALGWVALYALEFMPRGAPQP